MKTQTFAVLLGAALIAGPVLGQETKKNKAGAKAAVTAKPAAKAAPKVAPVPPPPFVPVFWTAGAPAHSYAQNDPQQFYAWLEEKKKSIPGKIDEFSSKEEREQYQARLAETMQAIGPIAFITDCSAKYDGEKQQFRILERAEPIDDYWLREPHVSKLNVRKLTLTLRDIEDTKYPAQNAFGGTTAVRKWVNEEFVLAYPRGAQNEPAALIEDDVAARLNMVYRNSAVMYEGWAPMPSDQAREKHGEIACLAVFSLQAPYAFTYTETHAPTLDVPVDKTTKGYALYGRLDRFQIVNKKSGEVYKDYARAGL